MISAVNLRLLLNGNNFENMLKKDLQYLLFFVLLIGVQTALFAQKPVTSGLAEKNPNKIAVIMPFCSKQILADPNHKNAALGNACREYYQGLLMAMDSFKKSPNPIELTIYDTQGDSNVFRQILNKKEFQENTLLFGPVVRDAHPIMKAYCEKFEVYYISPFLTLTKSKIDNPYLISAYPDLGYYADFILNHIRTGGFEDENVVVFTNKSANEKIIADRMLALQKKYSDFNLKILDITKYAEYSSLFLLGKANYVIIDCDNEFLVNNTLRFLSDPTKFQGLTVYGSKKWLDFKSFNLTVWEQINVNLVNPFYVDYNNPKVKSFIASYKKHYYTEPSEYAFHGYEQGIFFINAYILYSGRMDCLLEQKPEKILCNWFKISRKDNSKGMQNTKLNLLYFDNDEMKCWD